MGKRLGDAVFDNAILNVDYSGVQKSNVYINGTKWAVDSNSRYQGKFVDVTNYKGWAFKIGGVWIPNGNNGYWWLRFAMVTSKSFSNGGDIPFVNVAPYNAKVENSTSEWHEGVIPSIEGNIYLYIYCYNSTGNPVDFPPELYVTDPNPSSRIEGLETLTDGVDEIKEGWFAVSGEDYDYSVPADDCWKKQGISPSANSLGDTFSNNYSEYFRTFPKSASFNNAAASPADCYSVADLPDKVLSLTFAEVTPNSNVYWTIRLVLYDASLTCLSVSDWLSTGPSQDYKLEVNIGATSPNAAYFKIVVSRNVSSDNWAYNDGNMSFVKRPVAQDSMPDRVEALEEKVAELSGAGVSKFRICSWNVGHWCLGGNYKTDINTQAKYEEMRGKWRTKLNEMSPDVIGMCEYSTVFAELGANIEAKDAIFGQYAYRAIGSVPSATSWMQTAQYTNIPIRNTSEVVYAQTVQAGRYYQVSDLVLGGITAKLVITHLDWGNSQNNGDACRAAQMQTLIDAFANESHVIICGDFNNPLSSEWDVFANAGYSMANHGYMGDLPTYPATKVENGETVPPDKTIDNILVKGFAVSKIEIVDDATLTDHCGVVCDLTLI
jgi:endonuclease/exonuclease/phosphatase family metal-dependent hydrolase